MSCTGRAVADSQQQRQRLSRRCDLDVWNLDVHTGRQQGIKAMVKMVPEAKVNEPQRQR